MCHHFEIRASEVKKVKSAQSQIILSVPPCFHQHMINSLLSLGVFALNYLIFFLVLT